MNSIETENSQLTQTVRSGMGHQMVEEEDLTKDDILPLILAQEGGHDQIR